ncbi:unnamed protein product [Caretta caretta]
MMLVIAIASLRALTKVSPREPYKTRNGVLELLEPYHADRYSTETIASFGTLKAALEVCNGLAPGGGARGYPAMWILLQHSVFWKE